MSRKRKTIPRDVQIAQQRLDGMRTVDERLDFGNGVSVETLAAAIKRVTDGIGGYNMLLAEADARANTIDADTQTMNSLAKAALVGAEYKYGDDSNELEMIGGTRKSDRKRGSRKQAGGTGEMK